MRVKINIDGNTSDIMGLKTSIDTLLKKYFTKYKLNWEEHSEPEVNK